MKTVYKTLILIAIFSIAMGFLESAVVVYIRELYYPAGFNFPIIPTSNLVLFTELGRELATLIMLLCIGIIAGKNFAQRFVFFLYSFAIWDLFYYVFLKVLIDWPQSLFTWDILFLLPVPWVGPVLAPCLLSLTMILLTLMVVHLQEKGHAVRFRLWDWVLMIGASVIIIGSFTIDYFQMLSKAHGAYDSSQMLEIIKRYIPISYNWFLFIIAEIILLADFGWIYWRRRGDGGR